jgi:NitT/TauT family transport system ATP-binding protein
MAATAPPLSAARLDVCGVRKVLPGRAGREIVVLDDCSFSAAPGELTVLVGPAGCGKTTLINLIAGYDAPTAGAVMVDGQPLRPAPSPERLVVFQENALWPWMTVLDNVVFGPRVRGTDTQATRAEAERLLAHFGLGEFLGHYPGQLSGGMQRRVELARALINRPRLLLLDEPVRGLDALTRELMQEFFLQFFEESRITTLFVTSEIEEAVFLADRIVVLGDTPTRVLASVEDSLPRPRTPHLLASPEQDALVSTVLEHIHGGSADPAA